MTCHPRPRPVPHHRRDDGFTLVELMIVVVVLGILVSISISGIESYRENAGDASVKTDLRNAMTAEEAYFATHQTYVAFTASDGGSVPDPDFGASPNVTITATLVGAGVRIEGSHSLSSETYCISSTTSEIVAGGGC